MVISYSLSYTEKLIGWNSSREGWFRLNTDGAVRPPVTTATTEGILCDHIGAKYSGFMFNMAHVPWLRLNFGVSSMV